MSTLKLALRRFIGDEEGVTALEYALLAALIALAIVGTLKVLGTNLYLVFNNLAEALD